MTLYHLTKRAERDLEDIWDYTFEKWSLEQAEKYVGGLLSCFTDIAGGHVKGKPVNHIRDGYHKALYVKHYVFYRISPDNMIEIIRILHVNMDVENRLILDYHT